jgi:hypothetical protein
MANTSNTGPNPGDTNTTAQTQTPIAEVFGTPGTGKVPQWNGTTGRFEWTDLSAAYVTHAGPSNGTDDTATLNALLTAAGAAGRGYVRGKPGETYLLSAFLAVPSNTTLDMTGCSVKLKNGSAETNFVRNANYSNVARVMDGAITSGATALACATSTPFTGAYAVIGTPVLVWGAGKFGTNLTTTIASVTNSGHVVLADPALTTVSAATVSIGTRDSRVRVIGGKWDRNGITTTGGPDTGDGLKFRSVDGVTVENVAFVSTGFHDVNVADCTQVHLDNIHGQQMGETDLVHLNGPLDAVHIRNVHGTCHSCFVALCPNDYTGTTSTPEDVWGWITNVEIDGIHAENPSDGLLLAVEGGGPGMGTRHVRAANISGYAGGSSGAVLIGDDNASALTVGGRIEDVEVDVQGIAWNSSVATYGITCNPSNGKNITILNAGLNLDGGGGHGAALVGATSLTNLESLVIKQVRLGTFNDSGPTILEVAGTITNVKIDDVTGGNGTYALALTGSGSVTRAKIANVAMNGRLSPVQAPAGTTLTTVKLANYETSTDGYALGDYGITTELHCVNFKASSGANNLINLGASAIVSLYGANCNFGTLAPGGTAGGKLRCRSYGIPLDVSNSFIAKNNGDLAHNTNAAVAGGIGPAQCDGTYWNAVRTPTWHLPVDVRGSSANTNWSTLDTGLLRVLSTGAQNAAISYDVTFPAAGTWALDLIHNQFSSRGIYTVTVGGSAPTALGGSADTIDGYNASQTPVRSSITGMVVTAPGKQTVTLTMATKNASSSGFTGDIAGMVFRRTA